MKYALPLLAQQEVPGASTAVHFAGAGARGAVSGEVMATTPATVPMVNANAMSNGRMLYSTAPGP